jgi:competence protein ComEC
LYLSEPKYAVISCGKDNSYNHPNEEVLSRLADADVTVYRTDKNGTVICKSDGENLSFTTEKDG